MSLDFLLVIPIQNRAHAAAGTELLGAIRRQRVQWCLHLLRGLVQLLTEVLVQKLIDQLLNLLVGVLVARILLPQMLLQRLDDLSGGSSPFHFHEFLVMVHLVIRERERVVFLSGVLVDGVLELLRAAKFVLAVETGLRVGHRGMLGVTDYRIRLRLSGVLRLVVVE